MFKPEGKSKWYFLLIFFIAVLIGWTAYAQYKPLIIKSSCSEIAARSSGFFYSQEGAFEDNYSYEIIKDRCIQNSGLNK